MTKRCRDGVERPPVPGLRRPRSSPTMVAGDGSLEAALGFEVDTRPSGPSAGTTAVVFVVVAVIIAATVVVVVIVVVVIAAVQVVVAVVVATAFVVVVQGDNLSWTKRSWQRRSW